MKGTAGGAPRRKCSLLVCHYVEMDTLLELGSKLGKPDLVNYVKNFNRSQINIFRNL